MSKILNTLRWFPEAYRLSDDPDGYVITMQLKRLRYHEANRLMVVNMKAFGALNSGEPPPSEDQQLSIAEKMLAVSRQAEAAERFCEAIPTDFMTWVWRDCVRSVGGIADEDGPVTTGERLAELADQRMVLWLLIRLQSHAALTSHEGKASSSPSTSDSEGQTPNGGNGASPATSTRPVDGQEGSTAAPIPN